MRHTVILCLLVLMFTAGCPLIQPATEFRSADVSGNGRGPIAFTADDGAEGATDGGAPREVVEPDIYRQRGNLLFVLNQFRGLSIIDMQTRELLGQAAVSGFPRDLYLTDSRAYVLTASATDYLVEGNSVEFSVASRLAVIDIADPASPQLIGQTPLRGDLMDSRLVGEILYAATANFNYYIEGDVVTKTQQSGTTITSFDVSNAQDIGAIDAVTFDGTGHVVQATSEAMLVGVYDYRQDRTEITYVDISAPTGAMVVGDSPTVPGQVADRFKLDIYEGVLRVVSNTWDGRRETFVTTFDLSDIQLIDQLGRTRLETASGDSLFAVRFAGDRAYVVTYFRVDPFYVIDLSDPSNPVVAGELEVPGWSVHLEPIDDDTLLALGVDDTDGRRVSFSVFKVDDPANPTLADRVSIGDDWSWSLALSDVRAFSVMGNVAAVPISQWDRETGRYSTRVQLATLNTESVDLRGFLEVDGDVLRTFETTDSYFAIGNTEVTAFDKDLDAPEALGSITLAERTDDAIPLGGGARLDISVTSDYNAVTLKRVEANGDESGATPLKLGSYMNGFPYGTGAILIGAIYDESSAYRVAFVETAPGEAPSIVRELTVDLAPYWGYGYIPFIQEVDAKLLADRYVPWGYYSQSPSAFLLDDALVLRGWGEAYGRVIADGLQPYEGLARIDLGDFSVERFGLGMNGVVDVFQSGNDLFVTNKIYSATASSFLPTVAYYVRSLDLDTATAGPRANVPGMPIDYDAANDVLTLQDYQWDAALDEVWPVPSAYMRTASWDGEDTSVSIIATVALPLWGDSPRRSGEYVFAGSYPNAGGYWLNSWRIGNDGSISDGSSVKVTSQWASILGTDDSKVYTTVGNGAVVRYDFASGVQLDRVIELNAYPERLRFSGDMAYIIAGYDGVTEVAR